MKFITICLCLFFTFIGQSFADTSGGSTPNPNSGFVLGDEIDCHVMVWAKDLLAPGEWDITIGSYTSESHGGSPTEFTKGDYTVSALVDGKWLGIGWMKKDQLIAQGLFVYNAKELVPERVGILYNPKDTDEQVSISCSKKN